MRSSEDRGQGTAVKRAGTRNNVLIGYFLLQMASPSRNFTFSIPAVLRSCFSALTLFRRWLMMACLSWLLKKSSIFSTPLNMEPSAMVNSFVPPPNSSFNGFGTCNSSSPCKYLKQRKFHNFKKLISGFPISIASLLRDILFSLSRHSVP